MSQWIPIENEPIPSDWNEVEEVHSPMLGNFKIPSYLNQKIRDTLKFYLSEATHWKKKPIQKELPKYEPVPDHVAAEILEQAPKKRKARIVIAPKP